MTTSYMVRQTTSSLSTLYLIIYIIIYNLYLLKKKNLLHFFLYLYLLYDFDEGYVLYFLVSLFSVVHVYGSAYDMGYAQGSLLKESVQAVIPAFYKHIEGEIEQYIKFLPQDLQDLIAELGLDGVLDLTYLLTREWVQ